MPHVFGERLMDIDARLHRLGDQHMKQCEIAQACMEESEADSVCEEASAKDEEDMSGSVSSSDSSELGSKSECALDYDGPCSDSAMPASVARVRLRAAAVPVCNSAMRETLWRETGFEAHRLSTSSGHRRRMAR